MKTLAGSELVEVESQGRLRVDRLEGIRSLQVGGDVGEDIGPFANGDADVDSFGTGLSPNLLIVPQDLQGRGLNLELQPRDALK